MESILDQIKNTYSGLSKGQKSIADFILNHYEEAAYMTASRIGRETGVSESTVVRFATELGYSGFPHFQSQLLDDLRVHLTAAERMRAATHVIQNNEDILGAVLTADRDRLRRAYHQRDNETFNRAVDLLLNARRIYILGLRSSAPLASYLHFYMNQIFSDVRLVTSSSTSEIIEQLIPINDQDVLLALSFPRYATPLIKALQFAKKAVASTIMITDKRDNPFKDYSDCMILAPSDMIAFVDALTVPFSTVTALIVALAAKRQNELTEHLETLESIWRQNDIYEVNNNSGL
ncbi:MAG: MurR/RpiR family transcriptional regulator [Fastidiosipilaceae bacterium]|nr:MurR/RpiR family transcriptional regulator [Clostridiaceae bacterium]